MISDTYRTLLSYKINIDVLQKDLEETRAKIIMYESNLSEQVTKCAFTYTALENPNIRPEIILAGADAFTGEMREVLTANIHL